MFKYISVILSKFTQGQRIVALSFLLLSIVIISIGPKIVESLTSNDVELKSRVESQTTQILELNSRVTELNTQIISNQRECTDAIVEREREIMGEIVNLETRIKRTETNKKSPFGDDNNGRPSGSGGSYRKMNTVEDSSVVAMSLPPEQVEPLQKEKTQPNQVMLEGLNKIKKNLNKSINSKKKN